MKFLAKRDEPRLAQRGLTETTLSQWREGTGDVPAPDSWDELQNPMKRDLWHALLREQGHTCCYCGIRIAYGPEPPTLTETEEPDAEGSHIEHILPREHYKEHTFVYENLAISCQGQQVSRHARAGRPPSRVDTTLHCGTHKDNWPDLEQRELFVAPTDEDCETCFIFLANGAIRPAPDSSKRAEAARETIQRLNLNTPRLRANRRLVLEELDEELDRLERAEEDAWARTYLQQTPCSENGYRVSPFLAAIQYTLRRYGYRPGDSS